MTGSKKILFLSVNYNSYPELKNFLESISISKRNISESLTIDVHVADNTEKQTQKLNTNLYSKINVTQHMYKFNLGYMGGIMELINEIGAENVKTYNYVIISNVDILLDKFFVSELLKLKKTNRVGWIAPKIQSLNENKDRNPKILKRPSRSHLQKLLLMFKYPLLFYLYSKFIYRLRRKRLKHDQPQIYAGHGSLMIFSQDFIEKNVGFKYPSFLFGEELFFAELNRKSNLMVVYKPKIKAIDIDHISTGRLKRSYYCKLNFESLSKIIKEFWDE